MEKGKIALWLVIVLFLTVEIISAIFSPSVGAFVRIFLAGVLAYSLYFLSRTARIISGVLLGLGSAFLIFYLLSNFSVLHAIIDIPLLSINLFSIWVLFFYKPTVDLFDEPDIFK